MRLDSRGKWKSQGFCRALDESHSHLHSRRILDVEIFVYHRGALYLKSVLNTLHFCPGLALNMQVLLQPMCMYIIITLLRRRMLSCETQILCRRTCRHDATLPDWHRDPSADGGLWTHLEGGESCPLACAQGKQPGLGVEITRALFY